jgi:hypothetical protein
MQAKRLKQRARARVNGENLRDKKKKDSMKGALAKQEEALAIDMCVDKAPIFV